MLLDGEEVRACITPGSYAVGNQVTTIEGLLAVWATQKGLSAPDAAKTLHPGFRRLPKAHAFKDQATNEGHRQFCPVPSASDHLVN